MGVEQHSACPINCTSLWRQSIPAVHNLRCLSARSTRGLRTDRTVLQADDGAPVYCALTTGEFVLYGQTRVRTCTPGNLAFNVIPVALPMPTTVPLVWRHRQSEWRHVQPPAWVSWILQRSSSIETVPVTSWGQEHLFQLMYSIRMLKRNQNVSFAGLQTKPSQLNYRLIDW